MNELSHVHVQLRFQIRIYIYIYVAVRQVICACSIVMSCKKLLIERTHRMYTLCLNGIFTGNVNKLW